MSPSFLLRSISSIAMWESNVKITKVYITNEIKCYTVSSYSGLRILYMSNTCRQHAKKEVGAKGAQKCPFVGVKTV